MTASTALDKRKAHLQMKGMPFVGGEMLDAARKSAASSIPHLEPGKSAILPNQLPSISLYPEQGSVDPHISYSPPHAPPYTGYQTSPLRPAVSQSPLGIPHMEPPVLTQSTATATVMAVSRPESPSLSNYAHLYQSPQSPTTGLNIGLGTSASPSRHVGYSDSTIATMETD